MKRTALLRKTPLRRKTRLRPIGKGKYARRPRNHDYMDFIRWCECILKYVDGASPCDGRMEADHAGARGGAPDAGPAQRKTDDTTCIPACHGHHGERTDSRGYYKGWGAAKMRAFCDEKIHFYRNLYDNLIGLRQTPWRKAS